MKHSYDVNAPKRPVNLSLNAELVAQARSLTDNLSAEVESLLAGFVEQRHADRAAEAERLRRAAAAWSAFGEQHGFFADEFSTL